VPEPEGVPAHVIFSQSSQPQPIIHRRIQAQPLTAG
jgi:hypothetical protein